MKPIHLFLAITYFHHESSCFLKSINSLGQILRPNDYANHLFLYSNNEYSTKYATNIVYQMLPREFETAHLRTICNHVAFYIGAILKNVTIRNGECRMIYLTTGHDFRFHVPGIYWNDKNEATRNERSGYFRIKLSYQLKLNYDQRPTPAQKRTKYFRIFLYDVWYFNAKFLTFELDEKITGSHLIKKKRPLPDTMSVSQIPRSSKKSQKSASDNNLNRSTDLSALENEGNISDGAKELEIQFPEIFVEPSLSKSKIGRTGEKTQEQGESIGDFVPCAAPWETFKVAGVCAEERKLGCVEICGQSKGFFLPNNTAFCYRTKVKASPVPPLNPGIACECGLNNQDVKLAYERCVPSKIFPGVTSQKECTKKCNTVSLLLTWSPQNDVVVRDCGNLVNDDTEQMLNIKPLVGQPTKMPFLNRNQWACQCTLRRK